MAELFLTESFLDEMAKLDERTREKIFEKLELVRSFPGVGTAVTSTLLINAFGEGGFKVGAAGYDVFYQRVPAHEGEVVYVIGILHQRRIRQ